MHTKGVWNMTLYNYALVKWLFFFLNIFGIYTVFILFVFRQTTSVTRIGGPGGLLKVRVEIDKLGDLKLKISDLFNGRRVIGESLINFNIIFFLNLCLINFFFFGRKHCRLFDQQYVAAWISLCTSSN